MRNHRWPLPGPAGPTRGWRTALALLILFAFLVVVIRVFCTQDLGSASIWPANGALVVALIVLPADLGFVTLLVALAINIYADYLAGFPGFSGLMFSTLNIVQAVVAALLMRAFCGGATDLTRFRRLMAFVAAALIASATEATIGEILIFAAHNPLFGIDSTLTWIVGDTLGLIVSTPAILLAVQARRYQVAFDARFLEHSVLFLATVAAFVCSLLFNELPVLVFVYPLLVLTAFRSGPAWVLASFATVSIVATILSARGFGPLAATRLSPLLDIDMVQPFLLSLFMCAGPLNNALGERSRIARRLERLNAAARAARRAALAANEAKSQFIANISHEIRTPLNGVLGMAEVLANEQLTEAQRQRVDVIRNAGEVLLDLLNNVLDFAKIEAGKVRLETTVFQIDRLTTDVRATFAATAEAKRLSLAARIEPDAGGFYHGDPLRIRQILTNLVSNAIKFSEGGEVVLRVATEAAGIAVSVSDTGIGIPADKISKLFEDFEQLDASTTRKYGGTGLGLSICRDLVQLMGGSIRVESVVGQGSVFTVVLPLERADSPALGAAYGPETPHSLQQRSQPGDRLRILVAEDNELNQVVLQALFNQAKLNATFVDNGAEAVEAHRRGSFDVILMDIQMPVLDGPSATRAIRAAESAEGLKRTPIIAFTADVMSHHLERYREAGIDSVVGKPITFPELMAAIGRATGQGAEIRETERLLA